MTKTLSRPAVVAAADWSKSPSKRWMVRAHLEGGTYVVGAPEVVGDPTTLIARLRAGRSPDASVLLGVDFPLGLPSAYAKVAGVGSFRAFLAELRSQKWDGFLEPSDTPTTRRPFYPATPGKKGQHGKIALASGIGVSGVGDLLRRCERGTASRGAAECLFFTLGAKQVGRAAIAGLRDLVLPQLDGLRIWPFDGPLSELIGPAATTLVEIYPAEGCRQLRLPMAGRSKLKKEDRVWCGPALRRAIESMHAVLTPEADAAIAAGFQSDDDFDAMVGLLSMLLVATGLRSSGEPSDREVCEVEGWILGQSDNGVLAVPADVTGAAIPALRVDNALLERAIGIALAAHRGATDKGGHSYIRHPLRVMERVSGEGLEAMIAAVLHDVVEDSALTFDDLRREGIPETVVTALELVTKRPDEEGSADGYDAFIRRIAASGSRLAIVVKLADLADNGDLSRLDAPTSKDMERAAKYERSRAVLSEALGNG